MQVGRLTLPSPRSGTIRTNAENLEFAGTVTHNTEGSAADARRVASEIPELAGRVVPVTWSSDDRVNGFYRVTSADVDIPKDMPNAVRADYTLAFRRLGDEHEVQVESGLIGGDLSNDHGRTAERWHAPAIGATGYEVGANEPGFVDRTDADGNTVRVFRNLQAGDDPRWSIAPSNYLDGAVRVEDANGNVLAGTGAEDSSTGLTLTNGLVRASFTDATTLQVENHDGTAWRAKDWSIEAGGSTQSLDAAPTVVENRPDTVTVRYRTDAQTAGRLTLTLTLRRGSRTISGILKRHAASDLKVVRATTEAGSDQTGWVEASSDDGNGNRYVVGSTKSYTADTTEGGITKSSATVMDFYVGLEVGGSGAASGDDGGDLFDQYIGTPNERQVIIPR